MGQKPITPMSSATDTEDGDEEYSTGQITVNEDKVFEQLIYDQAESLVDGVRELIQNGVDAPGSDEVHVVIQPEEGRTVVWDNGDGMDLTDEKMRSFLTELANTSKADDPTAIGRFGIGWGQALCKGEVRAWTQNSEVRFDVKDWHREFRLSEADEEFDGFYVELEHYEDEVPDPSSSTWDDYFEDLKDRFRFMGAIHGVTVTLNGEVISDESPGDRLYEVDRTYEDDDVIIAVTRSTYSDRLRVYSNGIKVKTIDGHGLQGDVVTKKNLDVNMSRDKIKSGCEVWARIQEKIDDVTADVYRTVPDSELSESGREGVATLIGKGYEFGDKDVFKMANGTYTSLNQIEAEDSMVWSGSGDRWSDKLADSGTVTLPTKDEANTVLGQIGERTDHVTLPEAKDGEMLATSKGISTGYEESEMDEVLDTTGDARKLAVARVLAHKMGIDREIKFGEDEQANAWTDGETKIVITETAWTAKHWEGWVFQLWRVLAHEAAHNEDSSDDPSHGAAFNREFRNVADNREAAVVEVLDEIHRNSITSVIRSYETVHEIEEIC